MVKPKSAPFIDPEEVTRSFVKAAEYELSDDAFINDKMRNFLQVFLKFFFLTFSKVPN